MRYFRLYREYTKNTESPTEFHQWCALYLISVAARRGVYMEFGPMEIYPNMYIVLVGPSGVRKGGAVNPSYKLVKRLPGVHTFRGRITEPRLITKLSSLYEEESEAVISIFAPELKTFLGVEFFRSQLVTTLTDVYDSYEITYETAAREEEKIKNACISLLGASTEVWLKDCLGDDLFDSGFTARFIFVYSDYTKKVVVYPTLGDPRELINILEDVLTLTSLRGKWLLSAKASAWYEDWYRKHRKTPAPCEAISRYWERRHVHLLKVALLVAVSNLREDKFVQVEDLQFAYEMLSKAEKDMPKALGWGVTISKDPSSVMARLLTTLSRAKTITMKKLIKRCWRFASSDLIYELLGELNSAGVISIIDVKEKKDKLITFIGDENEKSKDQGRKTEGKN